MRLLSYAKTRKKIIARTNQIEIGRRYFLSDFYDTKGCWVRVERKSTKVNKCGWPSSVTVVVEEPVGGVSQPYYAVGTVHTVNATNLYEKREMADPKVKFAAKS